MIVALDGMVRIILLEDGGRVEETPKSVEK